MDMERLYNQITLEVHVHRYWDCAQIALRPIWVSEDRTEMQIAYHWLPLTENMPGAAEHIRYEYVSIMENPYQDPKYRPRETPGGNNVVFHMETGVRISSGYVFTVKTDNKDERPLPSMELLELRWHLSRIAHMQGAAEETVIMSLITALFPSVQALDPLSRKKLHCARTFLSVQPPSHRHPQSYRMCHRRTISVPLSWSNGIVSRSWRSG
jgi:hypothetical protein